ncbi:MAG: glycoside hydrolase family 3 N-terminal domain-containing protein [Thermodesulfobacteriota bacterium]|nr:glycoside hydrolase family 3 N-terminal domain-containing protein [Thermodesulfobacteriota bacterium]
MFRINVPRHPGWGRAQEIFAEDPHLLGEMGSAAIRGLKPHVMTCVKHFACNSIEESRFYVDVQIDEAISGWIILIAGVFLPYSDLILFDSWLPGNPDHPDRELYAYNWMIYFNGQCLMSLLPAFLRFADGNKTMSEWMLRLKTALTKKGPTALLITSYEFISCAGR